MVKADFIDIPPAGQFLYRPESLVPTATHDPFAGPCGFHSSPNPIAELGQRLHPHQVHSQPLETGAGQMQMGVIESGHHEMAVEIDDSSFGPLQFENVAFLANLLN